DQARLALPERHQPHQVTDAHRLLDQGGKQPGSGYGHVDAPGLVVQPFIARMIHPRHDAWHPVFGLGQQRCSAASSSELISQASASSHSAWGTLSTLMALGELSMSSTSCPFSSSSPAMERPTAPAPAIAIRISARLLA